ncbi:ATP-dependent RNA helicase [Vanrija albida]|uniref:RNA helicase n=1 Tax=Vanrija albida TaxID=181172 RepID=A0ABR3QB03_9TREE
MTEPVPKSRKLRLADVRKAGGLKRKLKAKKARPAPAEEAEAEAPAPRRRIKRDDLPWKKVNTSILPGMDDGGGMMMLEELDGVGIEWEEDGRGGRTARFVESKKKGKAAAPVEEEEAAEEGEDADADDAASDVDLPTFAGLDASDLDDEDEDAAVPPEPDFDDALLPEWAGVPVHNELKRAMVALDFSRPTEIQKRAVPDGLAGRDVVGVAETGSGKTLAYSLPILSYLLRQPAPRAGQRRPLTALVLCPTRELAIQVNDHLSKVLSYALDDEAEAESKSKKPPRISIGTVVGGLSAHKQKRILARGCDVLVATPGRLWDLLKEDEVLAAGVRALRFLVIDEADRMIETGHFAELESIVKLTQRNFAPDAGEYADDPTFANTATVLEDTDARDDMQTFVFSATLSKDLQHNLKKRRRSKPKGKKATALEDLVEKLDFRDESPVVIDLSPEGGLVKTLRESMIECVVSDKDLYLYYFLLRYPGRSLVFVGSIDGIRRLIPLFEQLDVPVYPLHSQLQQKQRLKNLDRFKNAPNGVLIATDVAARGLDIPHVDHVVHFNLPRTADAYVHRSGRTARAQNPGFALQLVSPEDKAVQRALLRSLERDAPPPELAIEGGFMPKLKERIALARDIEKAQHAVKKDNHDRNWLKEAAEAMDIDIDPELLSEPEDDPDAPVARTGRSKKADKVPALKAKLAALLAQPLVARGVSARYPTAGSRVIVDDVLNNTAHGTMLGAGTLSAYDQMEGAKGKVQKPKRKAEPAKKQEGHRERGGKRQRK